MHSFFADDSGVDSGLVMLEKTDAHHAQKVLRLNVSDTITVISSGDLYQCKIVSMTEGVKAEVLSKLPSTEAHTQITLYQGLPKADKMDLVVQKCTELGVARIVPVQTARCIVKLDPKDAEKKQLRWQKIAREAAKQSGRSVIPEIALAAPLSKCTSSHDIMLVPWEEASGFSLSKAHAAHPNAHTIGVLIGPEGGLTHEEVIASPFTPVTLGKRILRTETAGICALSALYTLYGDME